MQLVARLTTLWLVLALHFVAHLILALPGPIPLQTVAAFIAVILVPGALLIMLLSRFAQLSLSRFEKLLHVCTAGYSVFIWTALFASDRPGPMDALTLSIATNLIVLILTFLIVWHSSHRPNDTTGKGAPPTSFVSELGNRKLLSVLGVALLIGVALYFRFSQLGFSQFQGDEATPIVRAAGVVQGYEDVLFLQRRGPVDALLPAGMMALAGPVNEWNLRALFAFASVLSVIMTFLLGRRLAPDPTGFLAAAFLALNGYFIGFGRIMHYESILFLMSAAAVHLIVVIRHIVKDNSFAVWPRFTGSLMLVALYVATGLAAHYDGVVLFLPVAFLLWGILSNRANMRSFVSPVIWSALLGIGLTAAFYVPFILHSSFRQTLAFYSNSLVGSDGIFVNNLLIFAESMVFYNGALVFYVTAAAVLAAAGYVFWRQSGWLRWIGLSLWILISASIAAFGFTDSHVLPWLMGAFLLGVVLAPKQPPDERLLWIWFAVPFFQSVFLTKTPGTHFHVFFIPAALLAAWTLARVLRRFDSVASRLSTVGAGVSIAAIVVVLASNASHAQRLFLDTDESLLTFDVDPDPPPLWPALSYQSEQLFYGIPHQSGWKTIGALFATGELRGNYATNVDRWISNWYTRSAEFCEDQPDYLFIDRRGDQEDAEKLLDKGGGAYSHLGSVLVGELETLTVYARQHTEAPKIWRNEEYAEWFDERLGTAYLPLTEPAVTPRYTPVFYRFGETIALTGYDLDQDIVHVGDQLALTLRWRLLQSTDQKYTVFSQVIGPENRMIGQRDTLPSCETGPTSDWELDEVPTGFYRIPIGISEEPGIYPLNIGLYEAQNHDRLPIFDADENPVGDSLELGQITVLPE